MSEVMTEQIIRSATSPQDGINYFTRGHELLDGIAADETRAKTGILVAAMLGRNFALVGPAGDGKSTLSNDAWRILDESYEPGAVVHLTGQHDVKASHLIGAELVTSNEMRDPSDGQTWVESKTLRIDGSIHPDLTWLDFDEFNLSDPDALQAVNRALETRQLNVSSKVVDLSKLAVVGLTMNPTGRRGNGFDISERAASRVSIGVMVGDDPTLTKVQRVAKVAAVRRFKNDRNRLPLDSLRPIVSLEGLRSLGRLARATAITGDVSGRMDDMIIDVVDGLRSHKIVEGSGRLSGQVQETAQALAVMTTKHGTVTNKEVDEAVRYAMTARLGMLGKKTNEEINEIVTSVIG